MHINKKQIHKKLIDSVEESLMATKTAYQESKSHAQDSELRSESKWDTRGIEAGYLASAQEKRVKELKIDVLKMGDFHKLEPYEQIKKEFSLSGDEFCYIGDDILDMSILKRVGFSVAVSNARDEVKAICDYVTNETGGRGAVREVIDKILELQNKLHSIINSLGK